MSYFRPFTHGIITQKTIHRNIVYLYRAHSTSMSLGKRESIDKESNKKRRRKEGVQSKKWCLSHKFFYALFFYTYFLNGSMFNLLFYCHIVLCWQKVTFYEKFSLNLSLEVQILLRLWDKSFLMEICRDI